MAMMYYVRMPDISIFAARDNEIARLLKRIEKLEKRVEEIDAHATKGFLHLSKADREILELGADSDERIVALEAKVFPNLHRDLRRMWEIVPPTGETLNDDLDRPRDRTGKRKPKKLK